MSWYAEKVAGTEVTLADLKPNQRVSWGDGKTYHIRETWIPDLPPAASKCSDSSDVAAARNTEPHPSTEGSK